MSMMRFVSLAVVLFVMNLLTVGFFLGDADSQCAPGPPPGPGPAACFNGDVNGDQGLDIGDAVYLLSHLFSGGPAPVALAQGAGNTNLVASLSSNALGGGGGGTVPFNAVEGDTNGEFNTLNGRFTATSPGVYDVSAVVEIQVFSLADELFEIEIVVERLGGSQETVISNRNQSGGLDTVTIHASRSVSLATGDQLFVNWAGNGMVELQGTGFTTLMSVLRVRDI